MSSVDFKLNLKGLDELMQSNEMQGVLQSAGAKVLAAAGPGYETETKIGSYTAIQKIHPTDAESAKDNAENNTLIKALQATGLPMEKG